MESADKYPLQIFKVVRKQTFSIDSNLDTAKVENGEHPLEIYNKTSRFSACIIDGGKAATANIPVKEVIHIARKAQYAEMREMNQSTRKDSGVSGSAYSARFIAGNLKGKSPADVLLENPSEEGLNILRNQLAYLQANLAKYPNNQNLINAIVEAANLFKSGQLKPSGASGSGVTCLYNADLRPLKSKSKGRTDGKMFVYHISINWITGNSYPVEIRIENYFAPVVKLPDGRWNVQVKQRDPQSVVDHRMLLTANEFMEMLYMMQANMRQFELIHAKELWDIAKSNAFIPRQTQQYQESVQHQNNSGVVPAYQNEYSSTQPNPYYPQPVQPGYGSYVDIRAYGRPS